MKKIIVSSLIVILAGLVAASQLRGEPLQAECRKEIVKLCVRETGRDRSALRDCLKAKRDQLSPGCRAELRARMQGRASLSPVSGGIEIAYGQDDRQKLDFWAPRGTTQKAPLLLFVHGGGWSIGDKRQATGGKAEFYTGQGMAFASTNYRLVPSVTPADQARDIARAIAHLRNSSDRLGFDPDRIILMGHSAGAHLVALIGTDDRYLREAGVPFSAVQGVILLDGAGYDVSRQMQAAKGRLKSIYEAAFTLDRARQIELSPTSHAGAPNVRSWLILHVERRDDARMQAEALARLLDQSGSRPIVVSVPDSTHMSVNRDAGQAGSFVAGRIQSFLAGLR